ncbi:ATP-binding protein [Lentzea sp. NPDC060358]|uniref:ATP-binding protein n=1 Tax=Lentzea sp. NPDC060358 TaxID=3347103 RepID=UPI00365A7E47
MGAVGVQSSRMIGRDEELRVLGTVVERGGVAVVLGEPGIGKSRLATAAADHAVALGMRVLRGRAEASTPLRALSEALLSLGRNSGLPSGADLLPYHRALARFAPEWRDSGVAGGDEPLPVVAEGLLRLLGAIGRDTGCVLLLEDLHDADEDTVAVLDYLADNLPGRVAVLVTARSGQSPVLELVRGTGRVAVVRPARLDRSQVRDLVAARLGEAPAATVDLVFRASEGVPFIAEELLRPGATGTEVPDAVVHSVAARVRRLGCELAELLTLAAVFGRRFPLPVLRIAGGLGPQDLVRLLRPAVARQLVAPDDLAADLYSFRQALTAPALLRLAGAGERAVLARRAAEALETWQPGMPGPWCAVAADLRLAAGEPEAARRLFVDAGRRALVDGDATGAVRLLRRAQDLATDCCEPIAVLAPLLAALAEAGEVEQALAVAASIDDLGLDDRGRVVLHTTLALVAVRARLWSLGNREVETARALLGPDAAPELTARIDLITANLTGAGEPALRALAEAARSTLPVVACEALELLGTLARHRDLAESDAHFRRMAELAHQHRLPAMRLRSRARSGFNDALRSGDDTRLGQACARAFETGAVLEGHLLQADLVLTTVLRGEFVRATELADRGLAATTRLGLRGAAKGVVVAKAVMFAHLGQRPAMDRAVRSLEGGAAPLVRAVCETFCALAEEDRPRAMGALDLAVGAGAGHPAHHLATWPHGLRALLAVLDGRTDRIEHPEAAASGWAWHRQFLLLAEAVLAGRSGRRAEAAAAMAEHGTVAAPFALARRLGLRLVAEAALADGWGDPATWLREAEEYFHVTRLTAVAGACRSMLRGAGWTASHRRRGRGDVPDRLRVLGITARENEVLRLLAERLGNTEIARRLYISPRTAEKHVASLLAKTGELDRRSLHRFAIDHVSGLAG